MSKTAKQIFLGLLYASFLVPTIVIPSSFIFPFIVPKIVIFRSLAAALVAMFGILYYARPDEFRLKPTPLTAAVLLFIFSFTVSTFFGTDAYHSFWDNHERMLGLFTIFHYAAYYLVVTSVLKSWTEWKWALRVFLMSGTIVTVIGILQIINPELLLNQGSERVSSTLGNAIYLGGYGLFLLTLSVLLFKREQLFLWKALEVFCAGAAILAMYYSGTRGSFIGLFAGLVTGTLLYSFVNWKNVKIRYSTGVALALVFVLLCLGYAFRQTQFVQDIPMVGRILNSSLSSGTGSTRLIAWQIAVKSWREHPLVGWGPNNFFYAFNAYYNPQSLRFGFGETWFDNAHNIVLNTLTVQGVLGVISYLGIFGAGWWMLFKNKPWREKHPDLFIIGGAFLAAHLVQNLTVFENPTSYLFFMFWLAFINAQTALPSAAEVASAPVTSRSQKNAVPTTVERKVPSILIAGVTVVLIGWVYVFNYEPADANQKTLVVLNKLITDPLTVTPQIKEILDASSPHIDDIRGDIARSLVSTLNGQGDKIGTEAATELINLVYPALKENIALHPLDIRNQLTLAQLGQMAYVVTKNPNYVFEAEKQLTDAMVYSPRRQQLAYSLAGIKVQLNKQDEAKALLQQTITDDPTINENYWRLAYLYQYLGDFKKAKEVIDAAHAAKVSFTDQGIEIENSVNAELAKQATAAKKNTKK